MLEDAVDPNRREALRSAFSDLEARGESPFEHNVRTARPGEEVTGQVLGHDDRVASIVSDERIMAVDRADLPERLPDDEAEITFTARSDFSRLGREPQAIEAPVQAEGAEATLQGTPPVELKAIETDIAAQRARERDSGDRER
ncbi:hypothetical protein [Mesorhizobium sp. M0998]|uniref:hypothetical protein n=1 Tax=Mesorhizobium sp. M0998 TaxID=2957044 RepID=UPI003334B92F